MVWLEMEMRITVHTLHPLIYVVLNEEEYHTRAIQPPNSSDTSAADSNRTSYSSQFFTPKTMSQPLPRLYSSLHSIIVLYKASTKVSFHTVRLL
jgi:hypothetical protein